MPALSHLPQQGHGIASRISTEAARHFDFDRHLLGAAQPSHQGPQDDLYGLDLPLQTGPARSLSHRTQSLSSILDRAPAMLSYSDTPETSTMDDRGEGAAVWIIGAGLGFIVGLLFAAAWVIS